MKKVEFTALLALALVNICTQAQQVWKCQDGERVIFSDVPCPTAGKPLQDRQLQPNIVHAIQVPESTQRDNSVQRKQYEAGGTRQRAENVCMSESEIRDVETKASSITLGKKEKAFLADEVRRARQCRNGQGNYTAESLQISRDAQNDQSSLTNKQRGRTRAEGMHSAANSMRATVLNNDGLQKKKPIRRDGRALPRRTFAVPNSSQRRLSAIPVSAPVQPANGTTAAATPICSLARVGRARSSADKLLARDSPVSATEACDPEYADHSAALAALAAPAS